jgi:hypothetical protein
MNNGFSRLNRLNQVNRKLLLRQNRLIERLENKKNQLQGPQRQKVAQKLAQLKSDIKAVRRELVPPPDASPEERMVLAERLNDWLRNSNPRLQKQTQLSRQMPAGQKKDKKSNWLPWVVGAGAVGAGLWWLNKNKGSADDSQ